MNLAVEPNTVSESLWPSYFTRLVLGVDSSKWLTDSEWVLCFSAASDVTAARWIGHHLKSCVRHTMSSSPTKVNNNEQHLLFNISPHKQLLNRKMISGKERTMGNCLNRPVT